MNGFETNRTLSESPFKFERIKFNINLNYEQLKSLESSLKML